MDLPSPKTLNEIKSLVDDLSKKDPELFKANTDRYALENKVLNIIWPYTHLKSCGYTEEDSLKLTAYSIHRASNQLNETCNKLWAVLELAQAISPENQNHGKTIGTGFSHDFSLGTIIPAAYYSQVSCIVSILSLFGVISIYDHTTGRAYNLTRTDVGWKIYNRHSYLREALKIEKPAKGWHWELIQLYTGLHFQVADIPFCNMNLIKNLLVNRNRVHYGVLGDVSVTAVKGIGKFFEFIPMIFENTHTAFKCLLSVWQPPSPLLNRYKSLHQNVKQLYDSYKKEFPNNFPKLQF
jgi:hypothetical protein